MVKKLSSNLFLKTFKQVPRAALNLVVTKGDSVLLTKRGRKPFVNSWHIPGSFLLKNEKINDCLVRIAKEELGVLMDPTSIKLLGVFENLDGDPRGHVVDIMYSVEVYKLELKSIGDTKEMNLFKNLPKNIGFNHKNILINLGFK